MEKTSDEIIKHLENKDLMDCVTDIWIPSMTQDTYLSKWVYLMVVEGSWKAHVAVRKAMLELGYVQGYEYNLDSGDSDYYMARHKYILKEAADIFAESKLNLELPI